MMKPTAWPMFAVCLFLAACAPSTSSDPLLAKLLAIMVTNMPPYEKGYAEDISDQVCSIVSVASLDAVVGMKIGGEEVERGTVTGAEGVADGSASWVVSRSQLLSWTQSLIVIIQPDGECSAVIHYRTMDL